MAERIVLLAAFSSDRAVRSVVADPLVLDVIEELGWMLREGEIVAVISGSSADQVSVGCGGPASDDPVAGPRYPFTPILGSSIS